MWPQQAHFVRLCGLQAAHVVDEILLFLVIVLRADLYGKHSRCLLKTAWKFGAKILRVKIYIFSKFLKHEIHSVLYLGTRLGKKLTKV